MGEAGLAAEKAGTQRHECMHVLYMLRRSLVGQ